MTKAIAVIGIKKFFLKPGESFPCSWCSPSSEAHFHLRPTARVSELNSNWHIENLFFTCTWLSFRPRVFGSIWKYRMQWFSWRTCTVRAAGANLKCRRHELLGAGLSIEAGSQRKSAVCEATLCRLVLPGYQLKRNTLCLKSFFPFPDQNVCYLLNVGHLSHKTFQIKTHAIQLFVN